MSRRLNNAYKVPVVVTVYLQQREVLIEVYDSLACTNMSRRLNNAYKVPVVVTSNTGKYL